MRICCLIKEVPAAGRELRVNPGSHRLDRAGPGVINPFDRFALEESLGIRRRLAAAGSRAEVVALTMGPASAERALVQALALGADRGLHICDDGLAGSDAAVTARILARALERELPELVLAGQQSADGECCVIPAMVAAHLGRPVVTQVVALDVAGRELCCRRQGDHGYESARLPMPAVIGVSEGINRPAYPELAEVIGARERSLKQISLADLGVTPNQAGVEGSLTEVISVRPSASGRDGLIIDGADLAAAADQVVAWLEARELIP